MKYLIVLIVSLVASHLYAAEGEEVRHFPDETREVRRFLRQHEVEKVVSYCFVGKLNCRSVVFYKSKKTGERVPSFEDRFMVSTATRSVASRAFFLQQENGNYNAYGQNRYQNEIRINLVEEHNQNIEIVFDEDGFPSFEAKFFIIGTPDLKTARITYSSHWVEFTGDLQGKLILKP